MGQFATGLVGNQVKTQESAAVQGERANFWETEKERYRQIMTKRKIERKVKVKVVTEDRTQKNKQKFNISQKKGERR